MALAQQLFISNSNNNDLASVRVLEGARFFGFAVSADGKRTRFSANNSLEAEDSMEKACVANMRLGVYHDPFAPACGLTGSQIQRKEDKNKLNRTSRLHSAPKAVGKTLEDDV